MSQENKTKFNPKIGPGFENTAFGEGSILVNIDADGLKVITENLRVGCSILLKFNKVTTKGNKHYFTEILPPYGEKKPQTKTKETAGSLG